MPFYHAKTLTMGDATGTLTVGPSGATSTVAASDVALPGNWNSAHIMGFTLTGNTTQSTTVTGTDVIIAGSGNAYVGASAGSLIISVPNATGAIYPGYNEFKEAPLVAGQVGHGSIQLQRWAMPDVSHDRVVMPVLFSNATNSTGSMTVSFHLGVYTRNVSTLSLLQSSSWTTGITFSGTANSTLYSGMRFVSFPWSSSIAQGARWIGLMSRTTTGGGAGGTLSQMVISQVNSNFSGYLGSATSATVQLSQGHGIWSTTSTALPNAIAFSEIQGSASNAFRPPSIAFQLSTA